MIAISESVAIIGVAVDVSLRERKFSLFEGHCQSTSFFLFRVCSAAEFNYVLKELERERERELMERHEESCFFLLCIFFGEEEAANDIWYIVFTVILQF